MKKSLIALSMLFVSVLLLTGCGGGKTLTCTMSDSESGLNAEMNVKFKGDKVNSAVVTIKMDAGSEEAAKTAAESYKQLMGNEKSYMKNDAKADGKYVVATSDLKISEMTDEQLEDEIGTDRSYDGIKKNMEDQGYTCK